MFTYLKVITKLHPQQNVYFHREFLHPHSPLPRGQRSLHLCSRASSLSCEPEWDHRYARTQQARNKARLLSCALAGPAKDGEQPGQASQEAGSAWEISSNSYTKRATNQPRALPLRTHGEKDAKPPVVLSQSEAHLSHTITMQSSPQLKGPN